uniref:Uncharacterized protein n=1 Tax=Arundo donax TaxID=35708 RepID=A0A0A9AIB7_ARUDO
MPLRSTSGADDLVFLLLFP